MAFTLLRLRTPRLTTCMCRTEDAPVSARTDTGESVIGASFEWSKQVQDCSTRLDGIGNNEGGRAQSCSRFYCLNLYGSMSDKICLNHLSRRLNRYHIRNTECTWEKQYKGTKETGEWGKEPRDRGCAQARTKGIMPCPQCRGTPQSARHEVRSSCP